MRLSIERVAENNYIVTDSDVNMLVLKELEKNYSIISIRCNYYDKYTVSYLLITEVPVYCIAKDMYLAYESARFNSMLIKRCNPMITSIQSKVLTGNPYDEVVIEHVNHTLLERLHAISEIWSICYVNKFEVQYHLSATIRLSSDQPYSATIEQIQELMKDD